MTAINRNTESMLMNAAQQVGNQPTKIAPQNKKELSIADTIRSFCRGAILSDKYRAAQCTIRLNDLRAYVAQGNSAGVQDIKLKLEPFSTAAYQKRTSSESLSLQESLLAKLDKLKKQDQFQTEKSRQLKSCTYMLKAFQQLLGYQDALKKAQFNSSTSHLRSVDDALSAKDTGIIMKFIKNPSLLDSAEKLEKLTNKLDKLKENFNLVAGKVTTEYINYRYTEELELKTQIPKCKDEGTSASLQKKLEFVQSESNRAFKTSNEWKNFYQKGEFSAWVTEK
jgi:hypothetical protein